MPYNLELIYDKFIEVKYYNKSLLNLESRLSFCNYLFKSKKTKQGEYAYLLTLDEQSRLKKLKQLAYSKGISVRLQSQNLISEIEDSLYSNFIILHNHTKSDCTPSPQDLRFTLTLNKICKSYQKQLVDHLIWANGSNFSFSQTNILNYTP